jgi:hypothetical protein
VRPGGYYTVASKPEPARASTPHSDTEMQAREGERAPSGAGHSEPMLGGAPVSNVAAVMRFRALPELGWQCWWVELVEHCEVELWARWIGWWHGNGGAAGSARHGGDGACLGGSRTGRRARARAGECEQQQQRAARRRTLARVRVGASLEHVKGRDGGLEGG